MSFSVHTNLSTCLFPFILRNPKNSIFCSSALPGGLHIECYSKAVWWPSFQFTCSNFSLFPVFKLISYLMSYTCKGRFIKGSIKPECGDHLLKSITDWPYMWLLHMFSCLFNLSNLSKVTHTMTRLWYLISKWWVLSTALPWDGLMSLLSDFRQWNFLSLDLIFPMCEMRELE